MKRMKLFGRTAGYQSPSVEPLSVAVERGFALSVSYGEDGAAGDMLGGDGDEGIYEI